MNDTCEPALNSAPMMASATESVVWSMSATKSMSASARKIWRTTDGGQLGARRAGQIGDARGEPTDWDQFAGRQIVRLLGKVVRLLRARAASFAYRLRFLATSCGRSFAVATCEG